MLCDIDGIPIDEQIIIDKYLFVVSWFMNHKLLSIRHGFLIGTTLDNPYRQTFI